MTITSVTTASLMTRLLGPVVAVACVITAACTSVPVLPASGSDRPSVVSRGCEHLSRHQYEVCYAYLVNDSLLSLVPYYQVGRQPVLGPLALTRLESRYYGAARRFIIAQTRERLATTTIETWLVRAEPGPGTSGRMLFAETDARHTIWLDRTATILCLAGHCLHKWVVVRIR
jgi:hypothetical protein